MFFDSKQFQVMTGSLQALSMQQQMILHNLANVETPGYKSKSVSFGLITWQMWKPPVISPSR